MRQLISLGRSVLRHQTPLPIKSNIRLSSDYCGYRELNYEPNRRWQKPMAEILAGLMWWWIGWHFMTDGNHLIGEWIIPNYDWSDEHLGIPPDD